MKHSQISTITSIFKVLKGHSWFSHWILFGLGVVNSILNFGILIFINNSIQLSNNQLFGNWSGVVFAALIVAIVFCNRTFQLRLTNITNNILYTIELDILDNIRRAHYEDYEKLGSERVYTAIEDGRTLSHLPGVITNTINSGLTILACLLYSFMVSPVSGVVTILLMGGVIAFYSSRNRLISAKRTKMREKSDVFYRLLNDLLRGFREMKLNALKNENFFDLFLRPNRQEAQQLAMETSIEYSNNALTGRYVWYVLIGLVIFAFPPLLGISKSDVATFIMIILYIIVPVFMLVDMVPYYNEAWIAQHRLAQFRNAIQALASSTLDVKPTQGPFELLSFHGITYAYRIEHLDKPFTLGPLNFTLAAGEIVFIVGGNGSGKSTFMNLLTGLYLPQEGFLTLNNCMVNEASYDHYRKYIAAIFTDHHLFSENYENHDVRANPVILELLRSMQLEEHLGLNGQRVIVSKLSKGQQKRMALIYALLDDRPVLALDEWAAEQDPFFRRYFYETIIPMLRRQGKAVVAMTHDDAYFHCADRIIVLDQGQVAKTITNSGMAVPAVVPSAF